MASPLTYSKTQIALHWLVAALVAFQILLHEGISELWEDRMSGAIANAPSPNPHAIVGIIIFALAIWRVTLRFTQGVPALPEGESPLLKLVAAGTHVLFYVLLIGMPISGGVAWFFGLPLPAEAHGLASKLLIVLILLHIAAALFHHFWLKTDVLKRMVGKGDKTKID